MDISQNFMQIFYMLFFIFPSTCLYMHIYMSAYRQYWKNNDIEMHLKKNARKWRLEGVLVRLICLGRFLQNAVSIKTCCAFSTLVNENWEYRLGNWHLAESLRGGISVTEKVVFKIKLTIAEYRRDRNISIYIWSPFSHIAET